MLLLSSPPPILLTTVAALLERGGDILVRLLLLLVVRCSALTLCCFLLSAGFLVVLLSLLLDFLLVVEVMFLVVVVVANDARLSLFVVFVLLFIKGLLSVMSFSSFLTRPFVLLSLTFVLSFVALFDNGDEFLSLLFCCCFCSLSRWASASSSAASNGRQWRSDFRQVMSHGWAS